MRYANHEYWVSAGAKAILLAMGGCMVVLSFLLSDGRARDRAEAGVAYREALAERRALNEQVLQKADAMSDADVELSEKKREGIHTVIKDTLDRRNQVGSGEKYRGVLFLGGVTILIAPLLLYLTRVPRRCFDWGETRGDRAKGRSRVRKRVGVPTAK